MLKTFQLTVELTGWRLTPVSARSPRHAKELVEKDLPTYLDMRQPLRELRNISLQILEVTEDAS